MGRGSKRILLRNPRLLEDMMEDMMKEVLVMKLRRAIVRWRYAAVKRST